MEDKARRPHQLEDLAVDVSCTSWMCKKGAVGRSDIMLYLAICDDGLTRGGTPSIVYQEFVLHDTGALSRALKMQSWIVNVGCPT